MATSTINQTNGTELQTLNASYNRKDDQKPSNNQTPISKTVQECFNSATDNKKFFNCVTDKVQDVPKNKKVHIKPVFLAFFLIVLALLIISSVIILGVIAGSILIAIVAGVLFVMVLTHAPAYLTSRSDKKADPENSSLLKEDKQARKAQKALF